MTGIYKTGTITLNSNSNIVTGNGTLFQTVANAREGDLFTLDGKELYEIYQVDTETQLRVRNVVTGVKYQGASVSGVNYAIIRNFAASTDAQIASDVVSLHLPLDDSTRNILNQERLQMLKNSAVLINLARGGLIDEAALKKMLLEKKIAGVALDVFDIEPPIKPQ